VAKDFEIAIVGAGVVGLAVAARISKWCRNLVVIEKNSHYGMETSSRNSEVIHAGIYYPQGSLKASLCVEGRDEIYALCEQHAIPHQRITKIIIARSAEEIPRLEQLFHNGVRNGARLEFLDAQPTNKLEPHISACASIFSPDTGIISAHGLMDFFYHESCNNGAIIQHHCEVVGIDPDGNGYSLKVKEGDRQTAITAEKVINAAGLFSDRIAAMAGINIDAVGYRLHYCKGSYFAVSSSKAGLISRLVYPLSTNEGLGVHALKDLGGRLKFGPDVEYLPTNELEYSVAESKRNAFFLSIKQMFPLIQEDDLTPDMCGIRPKLQVKGSPQRDFVIADEQPNGLSGFINLIGIESPGLTASPAIARYVEKLIR
jgi:L-2-hydroxyglutarate oxidase LhgO